MKAFVRIIGGTHRGKKLLFPELEGLRPTPDRVKETLFNWLMNDIRDARCLDAFAGSGALGLEAFSRGASKVTFIEHSAIAHAHLKRLIHLFNSPKLQLIKADARLYLSQHSEEFDLVFLDPPFAFNCLNECLDNLFKNKSLVRGGLVYIESPNSLEIDKNQWEEIHFKKAGQVFFGLFKKL